MAEALVEQYLAYHYEMQRRGDLDPQYAILEYVANRFELNIEQRYWIAFLFACTYCVPTVYYMYNEFPDYENADLNRMERWWHANRERIIFQTDRRWVRSRNQFTTCVSSYQKMMAGLTQEKRFNLMRTPDPRTTYRNVFETCLRELAYFGRYSLFLYLEAVYVLTGFEMEPDILDVPNAESSRNGLCYVLGYDQWLDQKRIPAKVAAKMEADFQKLVRLVRKENPEPKNPTTVWNVETTLCAFKKLKRGKRWVNYYIDRQADEIEKIEALVPEGVDWSVLWDHRREYYNHAYLRELGAGEERFEWHDVRSNRRVSRNG